MEAEGGTITADVTAKRPASMLANGFIESFERRYHRSTLETMLADRTTGRNIIWADDEYEALGEEYAPEDEITIEAISSTNSGVIKPRVLKAQGRQSKRTKARAEVVEIFQHFEPCKQGKAQDRDKIKVEIDDATADGLSLNDESEGEIPQEQVIGRAADVFGPKVYGEMAENLKRHVETVVAEHRDDERSMPDALKETFKAGVTALLAAAASESYGRGLKPRQQKRLETRMQADADIELNRQMGGYQIQKRTIGQSRKEGLSAATTAEERKHDQRHEEAYQALSKGLDESRDEPVPQAGETRRFAGHLFDEVVFDAAVREFIDLRGHLSYYFDDSQTEGVFDYVPPQRTNQIFTPKHVVRDMVDMLEAENPGRFDDPTHAFADPHMKSGLYIAEIVRRLYNSETMRAAIPGDREWLDHILERQVFGIALTKIIYEIATHYILGFHDEVGQGCGTNFVMADSTELAKSGQLDAFVEQAFGDKLDEG